jgi:hypothetical protein
MSEGRNTELVSELRKPAPKFGLEEFDPTYDVRQEAARQILKMQDQINALDQERDGFAQLCALRTIERDEARRARDRFDDVATDLAISEGQRKTLEKALKAARAVMRNAWGAVTSKQVADKQVDKMLREGIDEADGVLTREGQA